MERFAKRHRKTLNELLGTHIANPPSDSTWPRPFGRCKSRGPIALIRE
jgi:hypothetical protein